MSKYLLLRDKMILGPYSFDDLRGLGIKPTDLIWVNGISINWRFPNEIEELMSLFWSFPENSNKIANPNLPTRHRSYNDSENNRNKIQNNPEQSKTDEYQINEPPSDVKNTNTFNQRFSEFRKANQFAINSANPPDIGEGDFDKQKAKDSTKPEPHVIKVIIADDHTLFREGLKMTLSMKADISIVGEAENGLQLLHLLKHNLPDVILLDIQMPIMDGRSALASIRNRYGDLKVIMLSMYNDPSMVTNLMETGANAYLTKTDNSEIIYEAIKTCYYKSYYFNELTNMSMLERIREKTNIKHIENSSVIELSPVLENVNHVVSIPEFQLNVDRGNKKKLKKGLLIGIFALILVAAGIFAGKYYLRPSNVDPAKSISLQNNNKNENAASADSLSFTDSAQGKTTDSLKKKNEVVIGEEDSLQQNKTDKTGAFPDSISQEKNNRQLKNENPNDHSIEIPSVKSDTSNIYSANNNILNRKKERVRKNIIHLVTGLLNNFQLSPDGGLSNIKLTIYNQTIYKIDKVTVEVKYLLPDQTLYKTELLNYYVIGPLSSKSLNAPDSPKGMKVEYQIISIKSSDLQL